MKFLRCTHYTVTLTEDKVRELREKMNLRDFDLSEEQLVEAWKDERWLQRYDCQEGLSVKDQYTKYGAWLSRVSRNK